MAEPSKWQVKEEYDPTWSYNFAWGYDAQTGNAKSWRITEGNDTKHRMQFEEIFGRPPKVQQGDQLGTASYMPAETKYDGTLVAPPEIQIHPFYGVIPEDPVYAWFVEKFPDAVPRLAGPSKTAKLLPKKAQALTWTWTPSEGPVFGPKTFHPNAYTGDVNFGPEYAQIVSDRYDTPNHALADIKAALSKEMPNTEILLPDSPEDIFATDHISDLDSTVRHNAALVWANNHLASADMEGAMIAIFLPEPVAKSLHIEGGEETKNMHVTLVYFVDKAADRDDWDKVKEIVEQTAKQHAPLTGKIGGYGIFQNDDKPDVLWASPNLPGLGDLRRDLVEAVEDAGFPVNEEHEWTPHVTIKYDFDGDLPRVDEENELAISELSFAQGEKQEHYPFEGGFEKETMADRTGNPEIDALIEEFLKSPYGEPEWKMTGESFRNPEEAHGNCQEVTEKFVEFAKSKGFKAYETDTDLDEMGYQITGEPHGEVLDEEGEIVPGHYQEHTIATIVLDDPQYPYGRRFYVDFTATQYGYTDHPKVTSSRTSLWEQSEWKFPGTYRFITDGKETLLEPEDKGEWTGADLEPLHSRFQKFYPDSEQRPVSGWVIPTKDNLGYGIWAPKVGYGDNNELGLHDLVATLDDKLKAPTHFVEDWHELTDPEQYSSKPL